MALVGLLCLVLAPEGHRHAVWPILAVIPRLEALAFTGIKQPILACLCIALCIDVWQDSLIGKERMSQPVGGNKMLILNLEDVIVEAATELAISGECDVPLDNQWGGVDLVAPGYGDFYSKNVGGLRDGVRIAIEDTHVFIYKYKSWELVGHAELSGSVISSDLIVSIVKGLLA